MKHLILVAILCGAAPAWADPAADYAAAGKKAFAEGRYTDALTAFHEANKLAPDPKLIYAIAQTHRMAGDCVGAIARYEEFIKTKADDKLIEYSQANIKRCKEQIAAQPKVEPKLEPKVEPKLEPKVEPKFEPPKVEPSKPAPRPEGKSWTSDWIGHGLVIVGVGAAAFGTVMWTGGRADAADVNDAPDHESFVAARDAATSAVNRQRIGIALGLAGAAAIAGGVLHYRISTRKEARLAAVPAPGGGTIFARVSF